MKQTRNFVVTNSRVCNFEKEKLQRDIDVAKLIGITKSIDKGSEEFVIHFDHEYDYRFSSKFINEIIEALQRCYYDLTHKNLPIYGVHGGVS